MWTVLLALCPSTESLTHWSTSTPSTPHSLNLFILGLGSGDMTPQCFCVQCRRKSLLLWTQTQYWLKTTAEMCPLWDTNHFSSYRFCIYFITLGFILLWWNESWSNVLIWFCHQSSVTQLLSSHMYLLIVTAINCVQLLWFTCFGCVLTLTLTAVWV